MSSFCKFVFLVFQLALPCPWAQVCLSGRRQW